jgi:hypothetical protein
MKTVVNDERGTGPVNAYAAILDIKRRNAENAVNFTQAQKDLARRIRELAQAAHIFGKVYTPNFRQTKIAIKVAGYRSRDKLSAEYEALDAVCIANGVTARLTNNNTTVIYEIK